jgi:alpha-galactosidase
MKSTRLAIITISLLTLSIFFGCTAKKTIETNSTSDGICSASENCLNSPGDCSCSCGDGVCTSGEFCAVCADDCDCRTLAATPPMGWNSWNRYHCDIDEEMVKRTADAMVSSGMKDAGYQYINLDDCWQSDRDENGEIVADPETFPGGIAALADYVHALGLKFGLYTCAGTKTCAGPPGSYQYEHQDANTYASWEVDYVKIDWCFTDGLDSKERYSIFSDAFVNSGRDMVLSICNWGVDKPWIWGPDTGQLWRTSGDIIDNWLSMQVNLYLAADLASYASPGAWNDPDMLEVGNGGMSTEQYRSHFALWAIMSAPLISGNDLREMSPETIEILTNKHIIAINQDPAGLQGVIVRTNENTEVWAKPLTEYGARAVVLFNRSGTGAETIDFSWSEIGLPSGRAKVINLWTGEEIGTFTDSFSIEVDRYDSAVIKVVGDEPQPQKGQSFIGDLSAIYSASASGTIEANADEATLTFNGGTAQVYYTGYKCESFSSGFSTAESTTGGPMVFEIWGDNNLLHTSGPLAAGDQSETIEVSLEGVRTLKLRATPTTINSSGDKAVWLNPVVKCN